MNPRKGATTFKKIPKDVLAALNAGETSSVNLVEWMAINRRMLLRELLLSCNRAAYLNPILSDLDALKKQGISLQDETIGTGLFTEISLNNDPATLDLLLAHPADLVRCWAVRAQGKDETLSLEKLFEKIKPLATDPHFNVREVAWIAIRDRIDRELEKSLYLFSAWALDPDPNLRRFASEATRPRGVWCKHIEALKKEPELGLVILEPLKSDPSKYVRDSVGNWLNDASKTREDFVIATCRKWKKESKTRETEQVIKRAMRTLNK